MTKAMWRALVVVGAAALVLCGEGSAAVETITHLEAQVRRSPCDYQARQSLVQAYRRAGSYGPALREAAWLTWLAPQKYAQGPQGAAYLRDRRARDRAVSARDRSGRLAAAAMEVRRALAECCFNGAITQQTARLRADTERAIRDAEAEAAEAGSLRPVDRMALANMYLVLDDILALGQSRGGEVRAARKRALRRAAGHAAAVSEALPQAPGGHRTLAVIRARLAELGDSLEMWKLAVSECKEAIRLDPGNSSLAEMLWTLTLRSGDWEEASRWEVVVTEVGQ